MRSTSDGFAGLRRAWADWGETFSELELIVDDVSKCRRGRSCPRARSGRHGTAASGMEQDSAMLLRLGDGRIGAIEFHLDPELARRTGDEPPAHP